jgi:molybdopterin-guanine dinucleotide biosynthesis protein A
VWAVAAPTRRRLIATHHSTCTAAILAGGQGRRLGGLDKGALRLGAERFLDRQLGILRTLTDHLLIVSGDPDRYQAAGVIVVPDLMPGAGALGGLYTALMRAPTDQTIVLACDMPFVSAAFLEHLVAVGREVDAAVPRSVEGYHPLCASYSRACAEPIRRRIEAGVLRVAAFLADVRVREIGPDEIAKFDSDGALLANVNTPEDYRRASEVFERRSASIVVQRSPESQTGKR